jgi:hypothetical protein
VTLQRLAIAVFLAFGLSACDAPQFQEPNTAGEMFSSAPEMPGPLTELRQAVSAIEKQDPNPAALEQLSVAMKEFWRRCEMTVGCRDSDGEAMVAHSPKRRCSRRLRRLLGSVAHTVQQG